MATLVEIMWSRDRRAGDLNALVTDHFVKPGATVVDVGASWGPFTYHLARLVGTSGVVYSYEPHPANAEALQRVAQARPGVHFRAAAVSDVAGSAEMLVPRQGKHRVTAQSSLAHGFEAVDGVDVDRLVVPTIRLDDEIGTSQVDFVKIDVEGYELAVLQGGASMFRRCLPPLLIEIEQRHLSVPIGNVFQNVLDLGYHLFYIDGPVLRPIADFDVERDQLQKVVEGKFNRLSMPRGYVNNFCGVATPEALQGLPVQQ
jgi:FkbM family methyltransferase